MARMLTLGDTVGHYEIERELGRGGMGVVYLARDSRLDRRVALKVLSPEIGGDSVFRARFAREMKIAASAEHPNIVPVYEANADADPIFIVMRYVPGDDLRTVLDRDRSRGVGLEAASRLAVQLGSALDHAHAQGLVHRDVKPGNVLVAGTPDQPHYYLTDFGLAREAASVSGLTNTGQWMGTIDYVAPEQFNGGLISARTDIYAMGCLLFELTTGAVPYPGSVMQTLFAHATEPFPSVGAAAGRHTEHVDAVLARATAKDPADRFASAGDLARASADAAGGRHTAAPDRVVATGVALSGMRTRDERPTFVAPTEAGRVVRREPATPLEAPTLVNRAARRRWSTGDGP
jgi:serine/threonine-protein kinase